MPLFLSLRTACHGKHRPFIATYTPSPNVCTNAMAVPRLNNPSELPKVYGTMAPVSTTVLPFSAAPSTAAGIGHLQAVDRHEGFDLHLQQAAAKPQHVAGVRALEEQFAGEFVVFLVEGAAGDEDADGLHSRAFCQHSALYWSYPHARYALAPAGGNSRDPRRRGLPISGTKTTFGRECAGCSRPAFDGPERLRGTLALSRYRPENRPRQIGHRRRKLSAGEGRFPRGTQERHHEGLREGRQDLRPGEE